MKKFPVCVLVVLLVSFCFVGYAGAMGFFHTLPFSESWGSVNVPAGLTMSDLDTPLVEGDQDVQYSPIGLRHLGNADLLFVQEKFPDRYQAMIDFIPSPGAAIPFLVELYLVGGTPESPIHARGFATLSMDKGTGNRMNANWYGTGNYWRIGIQGGGTFHGIDVHTGEPISFSRSLLTWSNQVQNRMYITSWRYVFPDDLVPDYAYNDPYNLDLDPLDEGLPDIILPVSPIRTWDWLRYFGLDNVPGTQAMQQLVQAYWPETDYLEKRIMYYVILQAPDGQYKVNLYGVKSLNSEAWDRYPQYQLHYKKPRFFGLFGGYYEFKVWFDSKPTTQSWALAGYNTMGTLGRSHGLSAGWTGIKIKNTHRILAFGRFYPSTEGGELPIPDPPPLIKPPSDAVPPEYDPDFEFSIEEGLRDMLTELARALFVPSSTGDLPLVNLLGDYMSPAIGLVDRVEELVDFEARTTFPSGFLKLWGTDFAPTLNDVLGHTVSVPLFGGTYSLYRLSRTVSLVGIVGIMLTGIIKAVIGVFRGGGE